MLKPELKRWDCTDHDPIETWVPDGSEVLYWLTLGIGLAGSEAADNFEVCVATPAGLRSSNGRRFRPRGSAEPLAIVLQSYSWAEVLVEVQTRLDACTGSDWLEVQEKLRTQFLWEYEGMR